MAMWPERSTRTEASFWAFLGGQLQRQFSGLASDFKILTLSINLYVVRARSTSLILRANYVHTKGSCLNSLKSSQMWWTGDVLKWKYKPFTFENQPLTSPQLENLPPNAQLAQLAPFCSRTHPQRARLQVPPLNEQWGEPLVTTNGRQLEFWENTSRKLPSRGRSRVKRSPHSHPSLGNPQQKGTWFSEALTKKNTHKHPEKKMIQYDLPTKNKDWRHVT